MHDLPHVTQQGSCRLLPSHFKDFLSCEGNGKKHIVCKCVTAEEREELAMPGEKGSVNMQGRERAGSPAPRSCIMRAAGSVAGKSNQLHISPVLVCIN